MSAVDLPPAVITRREWLLMRAMADGAPPFLAVEAVASVAIEHPEVDYDGERRTWQEWEADAT